MSTCLFFVEFVGVVDDDGVEDDEVEGNICEPHTNLFTQSLPSILRTCEICRGVDM